MRVYALLLGIVVTCGYAYAAHVAVSSVAPTLAPAPRGSTVAVPASDATGPVWYGGVLDPIVVVAPRSGQPQTATSQDRVLTRPTFRCGGTDRSSVRTIS